MDKIKNNYINIILGIAIILLFILFVYCIYRYISFDSKSLITNNINDTYNLEDKVIFSNLKITRTSDNKVYFYLDGENKTGGLFSEVLEFYFYDKEGNLLGGFQYLYQALDNGTIDVQNVSDNLDILNAYHYEVKVRTAE